MTTLTTELPAAEADILLEPLPETGGSVAVWEIVRLALDSLRANKMRALLTMLGVIIGVASVVALISLGAGASNAITGEIEAIGTNVLTIMPQSPGSRGPGGPGGAAPDSLTLADYQAISDLGLPLAAIAPVFNASARIVAPATDTSASVIGTTPAYQTINNLTLSAGTFIDQGHVSAAAPVVVLGADLAQELFGSGQAVGQTVQVRGQPLRVVGVLATKGGGSFGSVDSNAVIPISLAQQRLFGGRTADGNGYRVSSISISATNSGDLDAIQQRIALLLRERHRLPADGSGDDFGLLNQAAVLSTLTTITSMLTLFLAAVAGISLLVGGIGIMNIMLVSVTERTREIGLRKAVGARNRDIMLQFVVEALALSLAGGLLGLLLGSTITMLVTLSGVLEAPPTLNAVLLAVGFSMAVGLFFGIYPASRAAKLNPIEALRHE
ncbi:MAG TPA: ABC transporter permease [Roseiflexaceae bacterium]|nr:ABC transporter permease [Roseiflexaceae bacterium]